MPYTDLIRQEREYNYSANIQFDIENDHKLGRFIPNETAIDLLKEYFIDITRAQPNNHSRILYGSYGTGKSHFMTVLSLLLSKTHVKGEGYQAFIHRVRALDSLLAADIDAFINNPERKPFLVVPVVFDFEDFDRCIYFSLKKKLESIGKQVSFKTFYGQAAALVQQWKQSEESLQKLEKACENAQTSISQLEEKLEQLHIDAEPVFQKVFADMTYGVKFIYEVSSVTDSIAQANKALQDDFAGMVFIFDEFGRYMEDNIKKIRIKAIQNLAEFCDHCDGNNHIILISHKEISQYTQHEKKSVVNEWKKVEARYKATPINDRQDQCLSLIRNILIKQPDAWEAFTRRFQDELNSMYAEAADFKGFLVNSVRGENPFEGGFPLHPISLYALDKLSKKVAQNERTFFTYLSSKEENSLYSFLTQTDVSEFHFVGIDAIYDYFEPNIKAVQSDAEYEWYKNLQIALAKNHATVHGDAPEVKLLKVIAAIGVINDASTLNANKATLLSVIDCPKEILSNALDGLCERRIIKYSGSYDRYEFYEASIYDVEAMIDDKSHEIENEAVVHILNEEFIDFALYPYRYNRNYKIRRLFAPVYTTVDTFTRKVVVSKLGQYYDGALIMLLADSDIDLEEVKRRSADTVRTIVFVDTDSSVLKTAVKKYVATKYLESQKAEYVKNDPSFDKELAYFKRELTTLIFSMLANWRGNYGENHIIIVDGKVQKDITSWTELSNLASILCENAFYHTLIVNNELINKNTISSSMSTAKKNAISGLLHGNAAEDYYGVAFLSPDYLVVRSVLTKNGFVNNVDDVIQNQLPDGRQPQEEVQKTIISFIKQAESGYVNFGDFYDILKSPPYGLRNGYLSLLLAHMLEPYRKSLIITSHDVEQELTTDLFEEIIRRPFDYTFTIAHWNAEQTDYLAALERMFQEYIKDGALGRNRLKAIYDAMQSHFKNVSKFARTTTVYVSEQTQDYRQLMAKSNTNYSKFFFTTLKKLGKNYADTINFVKQAKIELENAINMVSNDLADVVCATFDVSVSTPLSTLLVDRYQRDWILKRKKSFDYYTNAFLEFVSNIQPEDRDQDIIIRLSKDLTGLELAYWSDSHKAEFVDQLNAINTKLNAYTVTDALREHESKMTIITSSGTEKSIVFDENELSGNGKIVKNKINTTFGNFGMAISYSEKIQVLLSLLEDLLEGK